MENFEEHPYWRTPYAEKISALLPRIPRYLEAIKEFTQDPSNELLVNGFVELNRERFVTEFNRCNLIRFDFPPEIADRVNTRRINVWKAIQFVFGESLCSYDIAMKFNVELAMKLLRIIGEGIISNTNSFRQRGARPSGYKYIYLDPQDIEERMEKLFKDIGQPIEPGNSDWYIVASDFFRRFLFIHPFQNGNGRVARVLLSFLLVNYTIVPLCLFSWKKNSNEVHLKCLDEAHHYDNETLLRSLIIESVHNSLEACVNALEIQVS